MAERGSTSARQAPTNESMPTTCKTKARQGKLERRATPGGTRPPMSTREVHVRDPTPSATRRTNTHRVHCRSMSSITAIATDVEHNKRSPSHHAGSRKSYGHFCPVIAVWCSHPQRRTANIAAWLPSSSLKLLEWL